MMLPRLDPLNPLNPQVKDRFQLDPAADGISASMDGFMLLETEAVDVLRDNDCVLLQVGPCKLQFVLGAHGLAART